MSVQSQSQYRNKLPTICIVGRTNVGKSTLFNALVGARKAIVKDAPGVTRDRSYETVTRFGKPFTLIDTGALVGEEQISLHASVQAQTRLAMQESDLLIVVFDGMHGVHPLDESVVNQVRNYNKPVIWVANKCEKPDAEINAQELYGLGIDSLLCISAAHRAKVRELVQTIDKLLAGMPEKEDQGPPPIKIAIVGKPNVGKSTFVNKLLGEDRHVVSPISGTTRDSISSYLKRDGQFLELVDTAGLRKKSGVKGGTVERYSNLRTLRSLAQCDVVVFLLDASEGLPTDQDAAIINLVQEKGRALVLAINKWDLIDEKNLKIVKKYREQIKEVLHFASYAPVVFTSAKTGQKCFNVIDAVKKVYATSQVRLQTSEVNKVLERAFEMRSPPNYHGTPVKLLYATQVTIQPPTFAVFVNYPQALDLAYERYIKQALRDQYPFEGSEIRILFRRRSQLKKGEEEGRARDER